MKTLSWTARIGTLAAGIALAVAGGEANAQLQRDDLVIGVSSNQSNSFRIVRAQNGADPGVTTDGGSVAVPTPWSVPYMQTIVFDNSNNLSHNANGNLLAGNYGNGFTGFEIHNFATDGSGASQSLWSIKTSTGGARTDRGGGVSVSPDNSKIAWVAADGGKFHVLQYDAGSSAGTGTGAAVTGWLESAPGNGNGGDGGQSPYAPSVSQGSAWLDNDTIIGLSAYGELVSFDVAGATFGSTTAPNASSNWKIEKEGAFGSRPNAQFTDIFYNEQIAPNIIIGSAGFFSGGSGTEIYVWDKTTFEQLATVDISGTSQTGREISLDSQGNLYVGGFGNEMVSVIDDFVGKATNGTLAANSSVRWFTNDFFASYTGLDVASSMPMGGGPEPIPGDFDGNLVVDHADLEQWKGDYGINGDSDANDDGVTDGDDFLIWQTNFGAGAAAPAVSAVPEPATAVLGLLAGVSFAAVARRRNAKA